MAYTDFCPVYLNALFVGSLAIIFLVYASESMSNKVALATGFTYPVHLKSNLINFKKIAIPFLLKYIEF